MRPWWTCVSDGKEPTSLIIWTSCVFLIWKSSTSPPPSMPSSLELSPSRPLLIGLMPVLEKRPLLLVLRCDCAVILIMPLRDCSVALLVLRRMIRVIGFLRIGMQDPMMARLASQTDHILLSTVSQVRSDWLPARLIVVARRMEVPHTLSSLAIFTIACGRMPYRNPSAKRAHNMTFSRVRICSEEMTGIGSSVMTKSLVMLKTAFEYQEAVRLMQ